MTSVCPECGSVRNYTKWEWIPLECWLYDPEDFNMRYRKNIARFANCGIDYSWQATLLEYVRAAGLEDLVPDWSKLAVDVSTWQIGYWKKENVAVKPPDVEAKARR